MYNRSLIIKSFEHHGAHSGYDQIGKYLPDVNFIEYSVAEWIKTGISTWPSLLRKVAKKVLQKKEKYMELKLLFPVLLRKKNLFHFLYAENHYSGLLFNVIKGNSKIICTYHQPPSFFEIGISPQKEHRSYLNIDLVIVLSKSLIPIMKLLTKKDNVVFIPHGVDTNYFSPNMKVLEKETEVLTVGNWLRDFELLRKISLEIFNLRKDILFRVVSLKKNMNYFMDCPNVVFEYDLSDDELLERYRRAKLLLLPLKDTVANNALLEGMSCGLPSIISNVGAVSDYSNSECSMLVNENSPDKFIRGIFSIIDRSDVLQEMENKSRERCINEFDWSKIAEKHLYYYNLLS